MTWQEELEVLAETKFFKSSINDLHDTTHKFVSFDKLTPFITSLLKKQSKQEQINAMLDVLEDISKFPYSPSQLVPWNHILVEINKKITEIKALNAPEPKE